MKRHNYYKRKKNQINNKIEISIPDLDFNKLMIIEIEKIRNWYNNSNDKINSIANLITIKNELEPFDIESNESVNYKKQTIGIFRFLAGFTNNGYRYRESSLENLDSEIASKVKELSIKIIDCIERISTAFKAHFFVSPENIDIRIKELENLLNEMNVILPKEHKFFQGEIDEIEKFFKKWAKHVKKDLRIFIVDAFLQIFWSKDSLFDTPFEITEEQFNSKIIGKKRGRRYDTTAPQDEIEKKVRELIKMKSSTTKEGKKKSFVTAKGKVQPTPIRDFIASEYPDLQGDISDRQLFDRVKTAIDNMK